MTRLKPVMRRPLGLRGRLPAAPREGLGLRTLMDRTLAEKHGVRYVHLAAYAIDVDRVRFLVEGDEYAPLAEGLPLGWEVFLTEHYVCARFGDAEPDVNLLEDVVLSVLDGSPDEAPLGSQLLFAVHHGIARGALPARLRAPFRTWLKKAKPSALERSLDDLFADGDARTSSLASMCLDVPLDPPLAPPSRDALERQADRRAPDEPSR